MASAIYLWAIRRPDDVNSRFTSDLFDEETLLAFLLIASQAVPDLTQAQFEMSATLTDRGPKTIRPRAPLFLLLV